MFTLNTKHMPEEKEYNGLIDQLTAKELAELQKMKPEQVLEALAEARAHISHLYGLLTFAGRAIGTLIEVSDTILKGIADHVITPEEKAKSEEIAQISEFVLSEAKKNIC